MAAFPETEVADTRKATTKVIRDSMFRIVYRSLESNKIQENQA